MKRSALRKARSVPSFDAERNLSLACQARPTLTERSNHHIGFQQQFSLTYFLYDVILFIMTPTFKTDTVMFTVKGQVVIPRWLRKDFEINEGTRAVVYKQNDHIVLKPLTAQHYRRLRGSLKGTKAMEVFMSERKSEREL